MDYGDWKLGPPQLDPGIQATIQALKRPNVTPPKQDGYWVKTWPGAEEVNVYSVDNNPWQGNAAFDNVQGWTTCDKTKRQCQIMILRNANRECVEEHERRHAAGYDHPGFVESFACQR